MDSRYDSIASNSTKVKRKSSSGLNPAFASGLGAQPSAAFKLRRTLSNHPATPGGSQNGNNNSHGSKSNGIASYSPQPQQIQSILQQRQALPVYQVRSKLMEAIIQHDTLVLLGETGSGKTTQIPQFLLDAGFTPPSQQIAVAQPRRLAAITLAQRVANEMRVPIGNLVGYTVRFEDCTSSATRINFVTDGMLLREALGDEQLQRYRALVLDEAHERTVNTDILFGIAKRAQEQRRRSRNPLTLVIMSATMDVDHFARYFGPTTKCLYLHGRTHDVQVWHSRQPQPDYVHACVSTVFDIHAQAPANHDILVFLTGKDEIEHAAAQIRAIARADLEAPSCSSANPIRLLVFTLYTQLMHGKQRDVFRPTPPNARKVIISTNIAETSLTIRGIRYVVDGGRVKRSTYSPVSGMETLRVERIAQDQAWQRTGRAGREAPGSCYRMYTLAEYEALPATCVPEILRGNIAGTVLQLAAIGIDCARFDFIDRPDAAATQDAVRRLHELGAFQTEPIWQPGGPQPLLSVVGRQMARFPLDPRFARLLIAAPTFDCLDEMLSIVALLSGENVFFEPADGRQRAEAALAHGKFAADGGDHQTLLRVFEEYERMGARSQWCSTNYLNARNLEYAQQVRQQLKAICVQYGIGTDDRAVEQETAEADDDEDAEEAMRQRALRRERAVRQCLLVGLGANVADRCADGQGYKLRAAGRQLVRIHPSSWLGRGGPATRPECVVFTELIVTGQCYMRYVTAVEPDWLPQPVRN